MRIQAAAVLLAGLNLAPGDGARGRTPAAEAAIARPILPGSGRLSPGVATDSVNGVWSELPPPSGRALSAAIYDPVRDRMLVVGGEDVLPLNDVWELSLSEHPRWNRVLTTGTPPPGRFGHSAIFDPVRDRVLIFGGTCGALCRDFNDLWELSLSGEPRWREIVPLGTPPAARGSHTAIYDPVRDRMIVFGGYEYSGPEDLWELSLSGVPTWTRLGALGAAPATRYGHTAVYDPVRDRMLVFGGYSSWPDPHHHNDVLELSLAGTPVWRELSPSRPLPTPRSQLAAIYDSGRDRVVIFGGYDGRRQLNDLWVLSLGTPLAWTRVHACGTLPSPRLGDVAIFDPLRDRMIVFGGYDNAGSSCADVWTLDLSDVPQWRPFGLAETRPQRRAAHHAIYDPVGDRMLVFGSFAWANDLWELPLSAPAWRQLFPGGTAPSGRTLSATIYDPLRKRLLLFGGLGATGALNDLWALSLEGPLAWTKLTPSGVAPGPRVGQTAVYDAPLDRMLVFGGAPALSSPAQSDVWELSLSGPPSWRELAVAGTPPPARIGGTLVLDPIRDRLILFGGGDSAYIPFDGRASLRNDLWQLSLSDMRWSELTPLGEIPGPRYGHSAVYDPVRDRMVVFAGTTQGLNDRLYALELSGVPTWSRLTASGTDPREHTFHTAVYDPLRDRMLVFGGWDWSQFGYALDGTWALTWGNAPPPPPPPVPPQAAANPINVRSYPNPARGTVTFEIEVPPPVPEDVELRIYDASGRLLRVITSRIPSGCHTVQWDRTGNGGERLDPGIYFYVFRAGATRMTRRLVILE